MIVGIPTETKPSEARVAITPVGVRELVAHGHNVYIQQGAGEGSSISDQEYTEQGARMLRNAEEVFATAELLLKVKEPQTEEVGWLQPGTILFTYLHLAVQPELTQALLQRDLVAIAYETVQTTQGFLPLLAPMSEVAGRVATGVGSYFLQHSEGGRGILLGGVTGVRPAEVVVIGAGNAGMNAAQIAVGMQANVTVLDTDLGKLRMIDRHYLGHINTLASNRLTLEELVSAADLVIGSVLVPGAAAPKLVTEEMVAGMKQGAVLVDIAIDQGGCFATSRETTHTDPVYITHGVVHYAVGNIPGAVPHTSTYALTNATLPYGVALADLGWQGAIQRFPELAPGVNMVNQAITHPAVADSLQLPHTELVLVLDVKRR